MTESIIAKAVIIHLHKPNLKYTIIEYNHCLFEYKFNFSKRDELLASDNSGNDDYDHSEYLEKIYQRDIFDLLLDKPLHTMLSKCISVNHIANCNPQFEYQQVNQYDAHDRRYHFAINHSHGGAAEHIALTGAQISSATEFNKSLLSATSGGNFSGNKQQLEYLYQQIWFARQPKIVKTIDFVGYDKTSKAYVFNKQAIISGQLLSKNEQDFFSSHRLAIKSLNTDIELDISNGFDSESFVNDFCGAFGERGIVALAWWVGSLFAEQLRSHFGYFPFFELCGQASSGKTTLIEIMWKLLGRRDYEGFNPLHTTFAGVERNFAKVANLPVILMESDANYEINGRGFNWENLKPAYNGRPIRERGVKNSGNETYAAPFRGALMAVQNTSIEGSEAILSRFIHLNINRSHHLSGGKQLADKLRGMDINKLSGFMHLLVKHEQSIIQQIKQLHSEYNQWLAQAPIQIERIIDNHALLLTILDAIAPLLNIPTAFIDKAKALIRELAIARQLAVQEDLPVIQEFWDTYEYLNIAEGTNNSGHNYVCQRLNHSSNPQFIAINLTQFEQLCNELKSARLDKQEIKRHIKQSRRYKYVANRAVHSQISNKTIRCFVFDKPKQEQ